MLSKAGKVFSKAFGISSLSILNLMMRIKMAALHYVNEQSHHLLNTRRNLKVF